MFADILSSVYRHTSTADLATIAITAPDGATVRAVAREAGERSPQAAAVLTALANRLARNMRDLGALEQRLREMPAQVEVAAPVPAKRKPGRPRKVPAIAPTEGVPEKLPDTHLPMPESWEDLTGIQRAWFERWRPLTLSNIERYGRTANDRTPAQAYAYHFDVAASKWGKRKSWAERFAAAARSSQRALDATRKAQEHMEISWNPARMDDAELIRAANAGCDPLVALVASNPGLRTRQNYNGLMVWPGAVKNDKR